MQLRMSPGGRTPSSRRRRPEEPPSSVTVTTPVSRLRRGVPTWCLMPRSNAERPVPPPMATSEVPLGSGPAIRLPLLELDEDLLGDGLQGVEDSDAGGGHGLERRLPLVVERAVHLVGGCDVLQVALVELQRVGDRRQV